MERRTPQNNRSQARPFKKQDGDRPYKKSRDGEERPRRTRQDNDDRPFKKRFDVDRPFRKREDGDRPYRKYEDNDRPYRKHEDGDRPYRKREDNDRPFRKREDNDRPFKKRYQERGDDRPAFRERKDGRAFPKKEPFPTHDEGGDRPFRGRGVQSKKDDGLIRLNKYIANAGICSRREADTLIAAGSVTVNGEVVTEMGYKVKPGDVVAYGGETLRSERKRYFLLNKPKGFITTVDDPQERQTVMMLIDGACRERIYPVGRLDRNTTGLLLFTNDGEMARRLTHPSTQVYKLYQVELNKPVTREDMQRMQEGIELEDGPIQVDDVQYVESADDKRVVGVALHSGRNRIVRRIFEHLGYEVHKLDRVVFAGLTKKDLPRGRYRELTEKEVNFLKMV